MTQPPVSVIIVSQARPEALALCLEGLRRQDHPNFEVIVVADARGYMVAEPYTQKRVLFEQQNISAARNEGLGLASGQVVAFIDDDAVAAPNWLSRLTAPFADTDVSAAGGFVRGRNGISYQWMARTADSFGHHSPLDVPQDRISLHKGQPGRAIRTEGTNCAFRRDTLLKMGGFDEAYAFYLDETDVNMRMAKMGLTTAIVPAAVVHHSYAQGPHRRADRVPLTLFDIGASSMVFWRRHAGGPTADAIQQLRHEQHDRLWRALRKRKISPEGLQQVLATLDEGLTAGETRDLRDLTLLAATPTPLAPFVTAPGQVQILSGRIWQIWSLRKIARQRAAQGGTVVLVIFSPTARPHYLRFCKDGYWEQRGGLFGRSDRDQPLFSWWRFAQRVTTETARLNWLDPAD